MIYLSGCVCDELKNRQHFGFMLQPGMGNALRPDQTWAADTGCYALGDDFDLREYYRFLARKPPESCLFATAPDVLGDWAATLERSLPVLPAIRALGYKVALVAQDGATPANFPWDECDAVFIGGTNEWKLEAPAVIALFDDAARRGKWRHFARVNSYERALIAAQRGADSIDGTFLAYGKNILIGELIGWMDLLNRQRSFW